MQSLGRMDHWAEYARLRKDLQGSMTRLLARVEGEEVDAEL